MKRKKKSTNKVSQLGARADVSHNFVSSLVMTILLVTQIVVCVGAISFNGIPAAFGDLDLNKRTDIVVIGDDGTRIDIFYQHQRQMQPPLELGFSCKSDKPVIQVYLADIDSDGNPNLLPLLLADKQSDKSIYHLKSLKVKAFDQNQAPLFSTAKLTPSTAYSLALNSDGSSSSSNFSNNSLAESLALRREPPICEFTDIGIEMVAQPLLFDLDGDLRTDFMSIDTDGFIAVWKPQGSGSDSFEKMPHKDWVFISREYFSAPHSNSFIDVNNDGAADIVLSSHAKGTAMIAYLYADPDPSKSFKNYSREFIDMDDKNYDYGQSTLVDINADRKIDHILPRCNKRTRHCEIIVLYDNNRREVIFHFNNVTGNGDPKYSYDYSLEPITFAKNYEFPITLRHSDLDGDGYTDFVAVVKNNKDSTNRVVYLHNILDPNHQNQDGSLSGAKTMTRTFEIHEIAFNNPGQNVVLVTLFDINEDGKVDMLIGASEHRDKPYDMNVSAKFNTQMVDACFMKVLVTNGYCTAEAGSNGQSARGPFICFELSQNDGKKMQGCSGQLSQSSHFALQPPYVIFGLGQTPHFVETLLVSIPGFGTDGKVRTRLLEQIVPDAQVIIIPRDKNNPNSWDYKMFLSPMSDLVFSTLIALAVLCLLILFIIFILHRQETLEDAAEHEEYKRHWPESR